MKAHAKLNLALVVGPRRDDGKHEVSTLYQRLELHDDVVLRPARVLEVEGFPDDTLVREALTALAEAADVEPGFAARIEKRIPVAAGLGGGSSDAAAALLLANATLEQPLRVEELERLAATLGADVPFFLREGPQLGAGDGGELEPVELPQDYTVLIVLPDGETKRSTAEVYRAFDARAGAVGWDDRRSTLLAALGSARTSGDLAGLPPNDLASSPLAAELRGHGAFRADVTGAGPAVYGLFADGAEAEAASLALRSHGQTWITSPAW